MGPYGSRSSAALNADARRLGAAFRAAREDRGLTRTELAEAMFTNISVVARVEDGRTNPTWDTLIRFAAALGYDLEVRFTERTTR